MIDNHIASLGQAEYEKRGTCLSCGSLDLCEITWCQNDNCECSDTCPSYSHNLDCVMEEKRIKCSNCNAIMEAQ